MDHIYSPHAERNSYYSKQYFALFFPGDFKTYLLILRQEVEICEQQYGFIPRKSTTGAIFALLMENYREDQKELHCVFID